MSPDALYAELAPEVRQRYTQCDFHRVTSKLGQILVEIRDGVQLNPYTREMDKVSNPRSHAASRLSEIFEVDPHEPHDLYWGTASFFVDVSSPEVRMLTESKMKMLGAHNLKAIVEQALFFANGVVMPACQGLDESHRHYLISATTNLLSNMRQAQKCLEGTHGHRIS